MCLRDNGFNYTTTSKIKSVNTVTIKRWVEKYPEALNNPYSKRAGAILENKNRNEAIKIIELSGNVLAEVLETSSLLLEIEDDLNKASDFIRVAMLPANIISDAKS